MPEHRDHGSPADARPRILQLCPNDHPPFRDLCAFHARAAAAIGAPAVTVFLAPPVAEPLPDAVYLGAASLRRLRPLAARLRETFPGTSFELALCHRYRALRVFGASRVQSRVTLALAHEFGFFQRPSRRLRARFLARQVRFAGVSDAVVAELARVVPDPLLFPNGIDMARSEAKLATREQALEALGLDPAGFTIGLIGRLHPKKQPQLAVEALSTIRQRVAGARLVVMGAGELEVALMKAAADLPVKLCGFVPDASRYLKALDVLLITSGESEAFSMVALEAMAAGVPVVSGPAPGPRFVLADAGFYFSEHTPAAVADAVCRVHAAGAGLTSWLAAARLRAEREFSVAAAGARLQAVLNL